MPILEIIIIDAETAIHLYLIPVEKVQIIDAVPVIHDSSKTSQHSLP